ncbi:hypothetical protein GR157_10825 [Burkholderia sp. 4701]|nr:hypothetical protein [Burkholderia sp. 4701]MXN82581.1 hypothetical protein [Burkholderia sp. 4812]
MRAVLQSAGLSEKRLSCKEALLCGFYYGKCHQLGAGFAICGESLNQMLAKADTMFHLEKQQAAPDAYKKEVRAAIEKENPAAGAYFDLGFACYAVTFCFGSHDKPANTEEAQRMLDGALTLRRPAGWFLGSLGDVGCSVEQQEKIFVEDVIPWLTEDRVRRWMSDENMALMSILNELAQKTDAQIALDSPRARLKAAARSAVAGIPVLGEALATLVFGACQIFSVPRS